MVDVWALMQYLFDGDVLGFIQACYVSAFQSADLFYGMLALIGVSALLIRTKSLLFVSIIWVLLGGLFIVAMPIVSGLAVFLMIMGLAGVLFKVFMTVRS